MKFLRMVTTVLLVISMVILPAAAVEFVPSIEVKEEVNTHSMETSESGEQIVGILHEEEGEDVPIPKTRLIITPLAHVYDDEIVLVENIEQNLIIAEFELENNELEDLLDEYHEEWDEITGGAPYENGVITDIFEVSLVDENGEFINGRKVTFSIKIAGVTHNDPFVVMHKPFGTEEWQIEPYTIDENDVITITVDSLSPFAIVMDNNAAPAIAEDAPQSPQTGVSETWIATAFCSAVILSGAAVLLAKKFRKTTVQ